MNNRSGKETEQKSNEAPSAVSMYQNGEVNANSSMIKAVQEKTPDLSMAFSHDNLINTAMKLKRKKTKPGIDGIDPRAYYAQVIKSELERERIRTSILNGSYKVESNRAVNIAKGNGKTRTLSVPTAKDRLVQRATADSLYPILSRRFHRNSYAYQQGKSQWDAVTAAMEMGKQHPWVVKVDLKAFFDTLNRERLLYLLERYDVEKEWIRLISKFIYNSLSFKDQDVWSKQGIGQGGPISPLLANTYLNPLDHLLKVMDIPFVRYADDILLFTKTHHSGFLVLGAVGRSCNKDFKVFVNPEKSGVCESEGVSFLGFTLRTSGPELHVEALRRYLEDLSAFVATRSIADLTAKEIDRFRSKIIGKAAYYKLAANYVTEGVPLLHKCIEQIGRTLQSRSLEDVHHLMPKREWIERQMIAALGHIELAKVKDEHR